MVTAAQLSNKVGARPVVDLFLVFQSGDWFLVVDLLRHLNITPIKIYPYLYLRHIATLF